MNTLLVMPNFKSFEPRLKEEGEYLLILPQTKSYLWGHFCSNVRWALYDLTSCNRQEILDQMYGKNNYELELYVFTDMMLLGKLFDGDFFRLFEPDKSNLYDVLQS